MPENKLITCAISLQFATKLQEYNTQCASYLLPPLLNLCYEIKIFTENI